MTTRSTKKSRGRRGPIGRTYERIRKNGYIQRQAAALWMNVLIGLALAVAYLTVWGGIHADPSSRDVAIAALKAFIVWSLSFIPGWLYIRFLGQRAGALMSEYVLNLHRLGWDKPQYLPEPPQASPYWSAWRKGRGARFKAEQNIYIQKFCAYYGRATTSDLNAMRTETNFRVRIDTLFPVFVTTATFAVGWIAVLWNTSFIAGATSAGDVLKFAFLGAYAFIAQDLIRRFFQSDLRPSAYASALLRVAFVMITMTALLQVISGLSFPMQATVAFVVGVVPLVALQAMQRTASRLLQVAVPQVAPDYPLSDLNGLNIWHEARLVEEGIEDMQNLATANLVDVILHTRVPVGRLIDWLDQATMALRMPSRRFESEHGAELSLSRHLLELRGIRSATDLLKAWPDPSADATRDAVPGQPTTLPGIVGLPVAETGMLVRVLQQDTRLAPVWNWQQRGVTVHEEVRVATPAAAAQQTSMAS